MSYQDLQDKPQAVFIVNRNRLFTDIYQHVCCDICQECYEVDLCPCPVCGVASETDCNDWLYNLEDDEPVKCLNCQTEFKIIEFDVGGVSGNENFDIELEKL